MGPAAGIDSGNALMTGCVMSSPGPTQGRGAGAAAGCVDLVVEADMKPYDFLAMVPIIQGAGGCITNWLVPPPPPPPPPRLQSTHSGHRATPRRVTHPAASPTCIPSPCPPPPSSQSSCCHHSWYRRQRDCSISLLVPMDAAPSRKSLGHSPGSCHLRCLSVAKRNRRRGHGILGRRRPAAAAAAPEWPSLGRRADLKGADLKGAARAPGPWGARRARPSPGLGRPLGSTPWMP